VPKRGPSAEASVQVRRTKVRAGRGPTGTGGPP
jgi:hypothetical protein